MEDNTSPDLLIITADIVTAYVSRNSIRASELPNLLESKVETELGA